MWWEAIDAGDSIALVYHPVWQDERHPVPIMHWIYYFYRAVVYGIPVRDIEFIQINVNRLDGQIQRVRFEDSVAKSYDDWVNSHIPMAIDRAGEQYFEIVFHNNAASARAVRLQGPHLGFGIVTWNHQFTFLEEDGRPKRHTVPVNMPLTYLTEEDYARYKLARRSQGDFVTKDSSIGVVAKAAVSVLILGVPYLFSEAYRRSHG